MDMMNVNFLAILTGSLGAWVLGALWYAPPVFGKLWQKETGLSDDALKKGSMAVTFGMSWLLMFITAWGMAIMFGHHPEMDMMGGMHHGLWLGLFFVATVIGINYLYQRRSIKLWIIDSLYYVLCMVIYGAVLGAWK